jgi:hypothetical protein
MTCTRQTDNPGDNNTFGEVGATSGVVWWDMYAVTKVDPGARGHWGGVCIVEVRMDNYVPGVANQYPSVFNIHTNRGIGGVEPRSSLPASGLNQFIYTAAATDVVRPILKLTQQTEGAVGHGVGMQFETQTSGTWGSPVNMVRNTIESTSTDVTPGSEDFDLVFKNMNAGAAASETFRILSGGGIRIPNGIIATSSWTMTLPVDAGTIDQVLSTDGTGITSWNTPSARLPLINLSPTYNVATTGKHTTEAWFRGF